MILPFKGYLLPPQHPSLVAHGAADQLFGPNSTLPSDGTAVGYVHDLSGYNNHAVQSGSARPTFKTNIQNGLPGILFDAVSSQYLNIAHTESLDITGSVLLYVVCKGVDDSAIFCGPYKDVDTGNAPYGFGTQRQGQFSNGPDTATPGAGGSTAGISTIIEIHFDGNEDGFYYRSTGETGTDTLIGGGPLKSNTRPVRVGAQKVANMRFFDGHIFEWMIYASDTTAEFRTKVREYLSAKWNITLA